jgi:hypothetical protein
LPSFIALVRNGHDQCLVSGGTDSSGGAARFASHSI